MPGARGEGFLKLAAGERAVLFTNRALADVERMTGKTVLQIMDAARGMGLGMGDTALMLQVGMEHARRERHDGSKASTLADAYQVMDEVGFAEAARVTLEALSNVLGYAPEAEEIPPPPPQ